MLLSSSDDCFSRGGGGGVLLNRKKKVETGTGYANENTGECMEMVDRSPSSNLMVLPSSRMSYPPNPSD